MSRMANGNFYLEKLFWNLYAIKDHTATNIINFGIK